MDKFNHKHSLGQNFLKDVKVLTRIIDSVDVKEDDLVIEIGPGQGALTKYLKLFNSQLLCFEIDERVKSYLAKYEDDKTKIIYEDFMKVNLSEVLSKYKYNKLYVIANLPYYITTPIIEKIALEKVDVEAMVLMVQNEVADRLCANEGTSNYGYISVMLNCYYDLEKLFFVSRKSFDPIPNVDSAVIKLSKKSIKYDIDYNLFNKLVKNAFRMKRKNIRNNLSMYDLDIIERVLSNYGLTLQNRAEDMSFECFYDLYKNLFNNF